MDYSLGKQETVKNLSKLLESKILLYFVVFLLVLKIFSIVIFVNFPQNIFFADITRIALIELVNQSRRVMGFGPLLENEKLNRAAELKAEDMVQKEYFSHQSPEGINPWHWLEVAGYDYNYAGENLGIGFVDSQELYNAWFNSYTHRANLLNPNYREVGTAILRGFGENKAIVVVQVFGSTKKTEAPVVSQKNTSSKLEREGRPENIPPKQEELREERVLSQLTETPLSLEKAEGSNNNDLYLRFLNFMVYDYNNLLQWTIYGFLTIIIGGLLVWLLASFNIEQANLLVRSIIIIVLLSLAAFLNEGIIAVIIPHQILI